MSDWYYRIGEKVYGPYSEGEVKRKIDEGVIGFRTSVSNNGFSDWRDTGACREFSSQRRFARDRRGQEPPGVEALRAKIAPFFHPIWSWWKSIFPKGSRTTGRRKSVARWCLDIAIAGAVVWLLIRAFQGFHLPFHVPGFGPSTTAKFEVTDQSSFNLEKTRNYWKSIQRIQKTSEENAMRKSSGKFAADLIRQFDERQLRHEDYKDLKDFFLENAQSARGVIADIENLATSGVDPALLQYKSEACDAWSVVERANLAGIEIINDSVEHDLCYATPESYALRFGKQADSLSEVETRKLEDQAKIDEKTRKWKELTREVSDADAHLFHRLEDVKALLTSRYNFKFD